ncbi:protein TUNAR isoform X1 [Equus przewalskii]|uniref:Protein TUNAR isoform X1 n=1 Tax=Equus przewalskii TaxID=9798 RepID=A0ABM4M8E1_EQUPR
MRQELAAAYFSSSSSPFSGSGAPGPGQAVVLLRAPRAPRPPPDALLDEETKASRVFIAAYKTPPDSGFEHQSSFILLTSPGAAGAQVSLGRKIKTFATKMVITSGNDEDRGGQEKESKEESVLAMLGIIGTILNLIVIIFVYIYTTL